MLISVCASCLGSRLVRFFAAGLTFLLLCGVLRAQTSVTTQHNDIARTGANTNETILTPTNVHTSTFGRIFSQPVDGLVYAQPLYMPGVTLGTGTTQTGTTHNIVFVATEHDSVYAFDADSNSGANANPLWQVSLLGAGEKPVPNGDVSSTDIAPQIGITSTPVIDSTSNTIYVVAKSTVNDVTFIQRLHALDITSGAEKFGGPVVLSASVPGNGNGSSGGTLVWDAKLENNRTSLLLLNGIVYIGFASHGDIGTYHGWILAYDAATLKQTGVWCASPNGFRAGIWLSGTGLAADVPSGKPYGRMFTSTGNGTYDATSPNYTDAMAYGDSIIKLDLNNGVPTMIGGDDFTPHDQASLSNADEDQASGGVVLLPDSVGGGSRQLVQAGKSGRFYVLNRENLGGYNPNNTTDPGESATVGGLWGAPAYWNGTVYVWGVNDSLKAFGFANGALTSSTPTSSSAETAGTFSPTPSISANQTTNGIVWSLKTDNFNKNGRAILYAHDATNVATLLYSSEQDVSRDNPGNSVKFIVPTIINGKVYVGSTSQLSVFGLLQGASQAATPAINPASESFTSSVQVTLNDTTLGASIFYTLDGTTPATTAGGSTNAYTGPITITSTTTVNAIAGGTGLLASPVASATYTLTTQVATPTFSPPPGIYAAAQSVGISSATPNTTIYYTLDGSPPTTSSTKYTGLVSVGTTETLSAIAVDNNQVLKNSAIGSGLYTISLGGGGSVNFTTGFTAGSMNLLGSAKINGTALQLTDGGVTEAAAAWFPTPVNIQSFTTDFSFQITPASATSSDGFTFTIQGMSASAIGGSGGALGYSPNITSSVAVKFDLYSNAGEGVDSTGLFTNGAMPTIPATSMSSSGVNLHNGDVFLVHITYDGTTLAMTITDNTTNAKFSTSWPVNIPNTVGGTTAYAGFTGATGGHTSTQSILTWTLTSSSSQSAAATPTFSPPAGSYNTTQTVTINDTTTGGASIFYTLDGTTPATTAGGSTMAYSVPITVSTTQTIKAIATATGYAPSAVASAAYTIGAASVVYQTAKLTAVSSGPPFRTFTYASFPDTTGTILDATQVGDSVTFTLNVATAGTYDIKLGYKKHSTRGISQLTINGTKVGATLDQYGATDSLATVDYGTFNFASTGNYLFTFTVTGKNASSSGYGVSFDDITLTP